MEFGKFVRSVRKISRKDENELMHGIEGDMIFKYDLPVVNMPMKMRDN